MDTKNNPPEHLPSSESTWMATNDYGYVPPKPRPPKTIPLEMSASLNRSRHLPKSQSVTLVVTNGHGCPPLTMRRSFPLEEPFTYHCGCGKRMFWELPEFYTEVKAGYTITAEGVLFSEWASMQTSS